MESFLLSDTPQHQLTCRRVKDCCALIHNTILKWQSLTSESFDVASKIVNTSTEGMHVEQSDRGELKHLSEVKMRLEAKLIEERENNYCRLQELLSEMENVVSKLGSVMINMRSSLELLLISGNGETPLFHTLSIGNFTSSTEDIFQAYSEELHIRQAIFSDLLDQRNKDTITIYLSCWIHQPCITDTICDKLECLLIDSGLRN